MIDSGMKEKEDDTVLSKSVENASTCDSCAMSNDTTEKAKVGFLLEVFKSQWNNYIHS